MTITKDYYDNIALLTPFVQNELAKHDNLKLDYADQYDMNLVSDTIRFLLVGGPRFSGGSFAKLLQGAINGEQVWLDLRDAARARLICETAESLLLETELNMDRVQQLTRYLDTLAELRARATV